MQSYVNNQKNLSIIKQFPNQDESAILIDLEGQQIKSASICSLAKNLPDTYKIHFIKKAKAEVISLLSESLSVYVEQEVLEEFITEIKSSLDLFEKITADHYPLVSFRVVTEEYVKNEHPSVSKLYHRDAAALTLTKCFYGEGAIYVDEANVKRDFFAKHSIALSDTEGVHNPDEFGVVPEGLWLLLKGEMYRGIDKRNQAVFDFVLGKDAEFGNYGKGKGLIHKGGRFNITDKRIVFTISTYKTEF